MVKYSDKFARSPRRNQIERVGRRRDLPRIRQVRRRPTRVVLQPIYQRLLLLYKAKVLVNTT